MRVIFGKLQGFERLDRCWAVCHRPLSVSKATSFNHDRQKWRQLFFARSPFLPKTNTDSTWGRKNTRGALILARWWLLGWLRCCNSSNYCLYVTVATTAPDPSPNTMEYLFYGHGDTLTSHCILSSCLYPAAMTYIRSYTYNLLRTIAWS